MNFIQELLADKVTTGRDVMISECEYRYTLLLLLTLIVVGLLMIAVFMIKEIRR